MTNKNEYDKITGAIIEAAINIHRLLGPGLLESTYESCLVFELMEKGFKIEQQKKLPVVYRGVKLECGYRLDLLVEDLVIVEVKSVERIIPVHKAQMLSYLKLTNCCVGLLINFNVSVLKDGLCRMVNNFPDALRSPRPQR
jgi:GxxExxY protein